MDRFGSNATAMGGAAGRCDAMVAAVESQAADGVLHIHQFMFIQTGTQFCSLQQIAEFPRDKMLTAEAQKLFVSYVRCAAYPDVSAHEEFRGEVEKAWPAYADDLSISRLPQFFWNSAESSPEEWLQEYHIILHTSQVTTCEWTYQQWHRITLELVPEQVLDI